MAKVGVMIKFVASEGKTEELTHHLLAVAEAATAEPGTLLWTVHTSPVDPNTVWVYEVYVDASAKQAHEETGDYAKARGETSRFLAGTPDVIPLAPLGGKGLA